MDEIIYLEQDEEITSVIDKLKKLQHKSVSLVIPKGASILQSIVNLKILKKEAENIGKDIALVTQDKIGRNLASQVGLSVYDQISASRPIIQPSQPEPDTNDLIELDLSPKEKQKIPSGVKVHYYEDPSKARVEDRPETPRTHISARPLSAEDYKIPPVGKPKSPVGKKIFKIVLVVILFLSLLVGFYLYYPKAFVTLGVASEKYENKISITVDNNINKIDESRLAIPGEMLESEKELSKDFSSTGTKEVGEKASGTVKLSNGTGDEQNLSAGSEFKSSNNLIFISTESVAVPKATASVDSGGNVVKKSGTADVKVQAQEPGDKYNIGAGTFSSLSNSKISAELPNATSGGVSKQLKIVSQDDINNAKMSLIEEAKVDNKKTLSEKAKGQKILDTAINDEEISFNSDKDVGAQADSFKAMIKLKSKTLAFNEDDYRKAVALALSKSIPQGKELILSASDEITTTFDKSDFSNGIIKMTGDVKTKIAPIINDQDVKKLISDKSKPSAESELKKINGVQLVDIYLRPSWWLKKVPRLDRNIIIQKEFK